MKAIIFAGGVGTRLWPLSRRSSPKQFEKVIGDKSTLQLAVERLYPTFKPKDIYIFTSIQYLDTVVAQLPKIPKSNIVGEPERRDVGPAVGLAMAVMTKKFPKEPIAVLWSDHLVKEQKKFQKILKTAADFIRREPEKIVFIGQKPRFASQNLGWIEYGGVKRTIDDIKIRRFKSFKYRPSEDQAKKFYKSKNHAWNIGYFVTTPDFLWKQYQTYAPKMYDKLKKIQQAVGTKKFNNELKRIYPQLENIHFDNLILENLNPQAGRVIVEDLKWSDVGAWEALKEALQTHPDQNVIRGKVLITGCRDSLVYNFTNKLVVSIDLNGLLVINTKDVLLVCHKDAVPKLKQLVKSLAGTDHEHLI